MRILSYHHIYSHSIYGHNSIWSSYGLRSDVAFVPFFFKNCSLKCSNCSLIDLFVILYWYYTYYYILYLNCIPLAFAFSVIQLMFLWLSYNQMG